MKTGRRKLGRIYAQLVQKRPEILSVLSFFRKIWGFFHCCRLLLCVPILHQSTLTSQPLNASCIKTSHLNEFFRFIVIVFSIYAIGDCIHGPMLAHKAEDEGEY